MAARERDDGCNQDVCGTAEHLEPIHYQSPALNGRRGVVRLAKSETMVR